MEAANKIDVIVFDKTGTLTKGKPEVTDILAFETSEDDVLRIAASLEQGSEHPLAESVVQHAKTKNVSLKTVEGFRTASFPFTTDIPFLDRWGEPLLFGPSSISNAHTADEHVEIDELHHAVDSYVDIVRKLLN